MLRTFQMPLVSNNDAIIQGRVHLACEIKISSKDDNEAIYQNLGRVVVKKTVVMRSCPSTIAIFITVTLTCGKDLLNDLQWLIKVLAKTIYVKTYY